MAFIEWDKQFFLGIEPFDEHHLHLIKLINQTHDDFINCAPKYSLANTLDDLIDYATFHFSAEENWMKNISYPGWEKHCKEHVYFTTRVVEMRKGFDDHKGSLSLEMLSFMKNWVSKHILGTDAKYGRHIAAKPR